MSTTSKTEMHMKSAKCLFNGQYRRRKSDEFKIITALRDLWWIENTGQRRWFPEDALNLLKKGLQYARFGMMPASKWHHFVVCRQTGTLPAFSFPTPGRTGESPLCCADEWRETEERAP
jgi:hypothetical protein